MRILIVIYATSEKRKCFKCGQEGHHLVRACPENIEHETRSDFEREGQRDTDASENQEEKDRESVENGGSGEGKQSEQRVHHRETVNESNEGEIGKEKTDNN